MRSASLNVTKNTTAADLQKFADGLGDGMRLRGRKVEGGYELYAKDTKPGLWKRMTGQTRRDARAAVRMATHSIERNMGGKTLHSVRSAMDSGTTDRKGGVRNKDIRGGQLKELASAAGRSQKMINSAMGQKAVSVLDNRGPGLDRLPAGTKDAMVSAILTHFAAMPSSNPTVSALAATVETAITPHLSAMRQTPEGSAFLDRLAMSSGTAFAYDLRQAVAQSKPQLDGDVGRQIFEGAFANLEPGLMRDKELANGQIEIGGETFTKGAAPLGKGAYGEVNLYTSTVDPNKKIVLKTAIQKEGDDLSVLNEGMKREANAHRAAAGTGAPNVVGFVGTVRMSDGTVGIAIENARHGNATEVRDKITGAVAGGTVTGAEAKAMRLLLLRDMAGGLAHMRREGKEMLHFDFKNENVFVGEGGVAKVGDFGLSGKGGRMDLAAETIPDNAQQLAPELVRAKNGMNKFSQGLDDSGRAPTREQRTAAIMGRFKGLTDTQVADLAKDQEAAFKHNERRKFASAGANGVDSWAFGYAAFKMMLGREMFDAPFMANVDDRIEAFGRSSDQVDRSGDRAIDVNTADTTPGQDWIHRADGAFAGSTGDRQVDDLINGLLHPDPAQRTSIEDALSRPPLAMSDQQIAAARQNLNNLLSPPANSGAQQPQAQGTQGAQQPQAQPQAAVPPSGNSSAAPSGPSPATQPSSSAGPQRYRPEGAASLLASQVNDELMRALLGRQV